MSGDDKKEPALEDMREAVAKLAKARKVKADEAAGVLSLWVLKGCKAGKPC